MTQEAKKLDTATGAPIPPGTSSNSGSDSFATHDTSNDLNLAGQGKPPSGEGPSARTSTGAAAARLIEAGAELGSAKTSAASTDASGNGAPAPESSSADDVAEEVPIAQHGREVDEFELSALNWRRFAGIGPSELVELVAVCKAGIRVAYARGESQYLKLLREGEQLQGVSGIYQVANQITGRVRQMLKTGNWVATQRRASDAWVSERRLLPVDIDSVRPSGQSATDKEKAYCYAAAYKVEKLLRQYVDASAIGRGDSGNGLWLFIALQQVRRSEADDAQIAKLLKDMQKSFGSDKVKIDSCIPNASRLVPAFGTLKSKGVATDERPHRQTTFTCFGTVRRVQLAELFG